MNHLKHALVSEVPKALLKLRVVAKRGWTAAIGHIESAIPRIKSDLTARTAYTSRTVRRYVALSYLRTNRSLYSLRLQITAISGFAVIAGLALLIFISTIIVLPLQGATESYFSEDRFSLLRSFFASTGGALIGATAISFSVVMIAVQLNFARMPHGLFRQLSSDSRLLGAFAITFILAVGVASLSLVPDASWSALALLGAAWSIILILVLFLYGYRRALTLINPLVQLRLIVTSAQKDMRAWDRRARRISPLLEIPDRDRQGNPSTHDMGRVAFFQANPQWTSTSSQAITRSISFARRYAEQRDYEVSDRALTAVLTINASYVRAKGKTFFAHSPIFDIPHATDGFINDTLEQLRQLAQLAIARGDEEQTRQIFAAMAGLVSVYMGIDYASEHVDTKEHAQLAASYLTGAVQGVLPHNMPDVVMEGVRLMGRSAELFLAQSSPIGIVTLAEKIAAISCTGALKESFRPVTLTGMEQLARLTLNLIRTKAHDIHYVAGELTGDVALVVEMFLNVPDAPLINTHGTFLAPYYSLSKAQTLGESLTDLVNTLVNVDVGHENASIVVRNIEKWAEDLPQTEKKLLLLAIEKKSHFTFDLLHWIAHVSNLLDAVANAPAADDHTTRELEKHAIWLISVLSWIPDDRETVGFVENLGFTEILFEAGLNAISRGSYRLAETTRKLLLSWVFKGGRHGTGHAILERSLLGLTTLVLWKEQLDLVPWLKTELAQRLADREAPDQEMRDRAAEELRKRAVMIRRREFEFSRINYSMAQIDAERLRPLLNDIADLLSPTNRGQHNSA